MARSHSTSPTTLDPQHLTEAELDTAAVERRGSERERARERERERERQRETERERER